MGRLKAVILCTVHLFFIADSKTGIVWMTKILTDPFHDVKMFGSAPLWLARGQLIDPMEQVAEHEVEGAPKAA